MPNLNDVKQQLREWEQSHVIVMVTFREHLEFSSALYGSVGCGTNCGNFEIIANSGPRFSSPSLSGFEVVSIGPDPNYGGHTRIELKHSERPWTLALVETGMPPEPTPEELEAEVAEAEALLGEPEKDSEGLVN